ncbi:er lumen retaining receptor [Trichoderma arundinaceum]|uniref:ER lumen protein-retaining receptor n=1 Tax=Trichoderma arundinaceum TaxID=490622 RepID=A0A395NPG5_TRIAR|nr:er lumen retaining receptor [Trichoderma arundinaceum]
MDGNALTWMNSGFLASSEYPHPAAQDGAAQRASPRDAAPFAASALVANSVSHRAVPASPSSRKGCICWYTSPDILILFIGSQGYIIYLMTNAYKPTNDVNVDTFRVQYLLGAAAALALIFPYEYRPAEILWAFSIWLESVAILPQLFMLQRTGEAETITTHYLFALGSYRALYIPNWIWRYFVEEKHKVDYIAIIAGIIQTVLYSDFFYIYYNKVLKGKKFKLPV